MKFVSNLIQKIKKVLNMNKPYRLEFYYEHDSSGTYVLIDNIPLLSPLKCKTKEECYEYINMLKELVNDINLPDLASIYYNDEIIAEIDLYAKFNSKINF